MSAESDLIATLEQALRHAEGKLSRIIEAFDHIDPGVVLYGPDDRLVFCNRRFSEIYVEVADMLVPGMQYERIARTFYRRGLASRAEMTEDEYVQLRLDQHRSPNDGDHEFRLGQHTWLWVSDRKTADGGVVGFRFDITARKRAEQELAQSEERFRSLLSMSSDWYWEQDSEYRFRRISSGVVRTLGIQPDSRLGKTRWEIPYLGITHEQMETHRRDVEAHRPFRNFEYAYSLPSGEMWWVSISGDPVFDADGTFAGYRGVGTNITARKNAEARIREMAEYDFLTGLPNRALLNSRFEFAVRQAERSSDRLALLFIDLDHFKNVNDSLGHSVGDAMLAECAKRLLRSVRSTDTVARLGGDEFIVLLPGVSSPSAAASVAATLQHTLAQPQSVGERELSLTPSIGITMWPIDGPDLATLIKHADLAMYDAKEKGRNQYSFYRADMNERVEERLSIENGLRRALDRQELHLEFQPIFSVEDRQVVSAEVLLRWHSPVLGRVDPGRFIHVAEESGLIGPIGEWMILETCRTLATWRQAGVYPFPLCVNISAVQCRSLRLVEVLQDAVAQHGLNPSDLVLELTETAIVHNAEQDARVFDALGRAGFRLVIDDFGTGYSNLGYLKRFFITALKVDQSFVRDVTTQPDSAAITRGIIGLAKSLGLKVIGEGVEHPAEFDFLHAAGCDEVQGFLLGRPVDAIRFRESF